MTSGGIGESDAPTEGYTVDQFSEDAVNLIRALDAGPAVLVGNSLGGTVAMGAAFLAPELVRGIVTCSTSAGPSGPPTPPETMQYMMRGASLPVPQAAAAMMDILFATDFIDEHPRHAGRRGRKAEQGRADDRDARSVAVGAGFRSDRAAEVAGRADARPCTGKKMSSSYRITRNCSPMRRGRKRG